MGGTEVWVLELQEEPVTSNAFTEISYAGMSAEQVAEARARELLLDANMPIAASAFGGLMDWRGDQGSLKPLWPELLRRYANDRRHLVVVARIAFALELCASGIVEHVHHLDLKLKGDRLLVDFPRPTTEDLFQ